MNKLLYYMDLAARYTEGMGQYYISKYLIEQYGVLKRVISGEPYIAATYYVPSEILCQYDVPVLFLERTAGFGAANRFLGNIGSGRSYLGMPQCSCSYQLYFEGMIQAKIIPPPSRIIASSYACDDAWMYCKQMSKKYNVQMNLIDVPRNYSIEGIKYVARQLNELDDILKKHYKINRSILNINHISDKSHMIKSKIDDMRIKYPGIINSEDALKIFPIFNDFGREYVIEVLQLLYDNLNDKSRYYENNKDIKLIWLGMIPLYNNNLIREIERKYKCRFVYEELSQYPQYNSHGENIYYSFSERMYNTHFFSVDSRLKQIQHYIEMYDAEGIIHFSQFNCRFLPPMVDLMKKKLSSNGVPILEIEGDAVDSSKMDNRLWDKLDAFFEILQRRSFNVRQHNIIR